MRQGNWGWQQKVGSNPTQGLGEVSKEGPCFCRKGWKESPPAWGLWMWDQLSPLQLPIPTPDACCQTFPDHTELMDIVNLDF